jgi:hypothetical protein
MPPPWALSKTVPGQGPPTVERHNMVLPNIVGTRMYPFGGDTDGEIK